MALTMTKPIKLLLACLLCLGLIGSLALTIQWLFR